MGHTLSDIFGVPSERTIQAPVGPGTHKGPSTPNPTPCHYILPGPCPTSVSTMPSFRGASFGGLKTVRNRGDPCIFAIIHLSCIAYLHPTYLTEDAKHGSSALQPRSIYQEKPTIVHSKVYGGWCLFRHHSRLPPDPLFAIPKLRYILLDTWQTLPKRFPNVTLDEFVIMPDHIHFILWLDGTPGKELTLGKIIAAYKSLTTVLWLQHLKSVGKDMYSPCRIWQSGYYERVIRMNELQHTRQYIRNNPTKARSQAPQHHHKT